MRAPMTQVPTIVADGREADGRERMFWRLLCPFLAAADGGLAGGGAFAVAALVIAGAVAGPPTCNGYLDEATARIKGTRNWVLRAVGDEGEVVDLCRMKTPATRMILA